MLGAVDNELVALAPVGRAHRGDVRARARLRDCERAERQLLHQLPEVGSLLLFVARDQNRQRREVVGADRVGDSRASVVQLLDDQAGVEHAESGTAKLFRHAEVHQPGGERFLAHVDRKNFLLVVLARARNYFLLGKLMRQLFEFELFVGQIKTKHRDISPVIDRRHLVLVERAMQ